MSWEGFVLPALKLEKEKLQNQDKHLMGKMRIQYVMSQRDRGELEMLSALQSDGPGRERMNTTIPIHNEL